MVGCHSCFRAGQQLRNNVLDATMVDRRLVTDEAETGGDAKRAGLRQKPELKRRALEELPADG